MLQLFSFQLNLVCSGRYFVDVQSWSAWCNNFTYVNNYCKLCTEVLARGGVWWCRQRTTQLSIDTEAGLSTLCLCCAHLVIYWYIYILEWITKVQYFIAMATLTCTYVSCNAICTLLTHTYSTNLAIVKHPNTQLWSCWLVADEKAISGHCHRWMNTSLLRQALTDHFT